MLIVDVRMLAQCLDGHIPGAVQLDYTALVRADGEIEGLLPEPEHLAATLTTIGLKPNHLVIAYDDDSGVDAARLLWTLDVMGHQNYALLDGGFAAWDDAGYAVSEKPAQSVLSPVIERKDVDYSGTGSLIDQLGVLQALNRKNTVIVDTRSAAEYLGDDRRAARGGHIPGAVHFDWSDAIDFHADNALRNGDDLTDQLGTLGITKDKQVIVYCQSNRRSSHTFVILKSLGFDQVRAYAGSWSEWGNDTSLPIE